MSYVPPWSIILALHRTRTFAELCLEHSQASSDGDTEYAVACLDAIHLTIQRSCGWVELIDAGRPATHRKEDDDGADQDNQARVLD